MNNKLQIKINRLIELARKFESSPEGVVFQNWTNLHCGTITSNSNYLWVDQHSIKKSDKELIDEYRNKLEKEAIDKVRLVSDWYEYKHLQNELFNLE